MRLSEFKFISIVLLVIFSVTVFHSHFTGRLYPSVHIAIFLSSSFLALAGLRWNSTKTLSIGIVSVLFVSVGYRLLIFSHPPTFHSIDVDWFTSQAHQVLVTGSIDPIPSGFYQDAPLHMIHIATVAAVFGVNVAAAQAITPLEMGIMFPLFGWVFAGYLQSSKEARYLAAVIGAAATIGIFHAWLPIAQSTTVGIFFAGLLALSSLSSRHRWRWLVILIIVFSTLVYMHKIPLALFTAIIILVAVIMWIQRANYSLRVYYRVVPALIGVILLFQLVFVTDFVTGIIGWFISITSIEGGNQITPQAATAVTSSIWWSIGNAANVLGIFAAAGAAWLYCAWQWWQTRSPTLTVILAAAAICTAFSLILIPSGIPTRGLLMIEPVLAALISTLAAVIIRIRPQSKHTVTIVLILLLATQSFALIGMPDNPQQPVRYAHADELEAKHFTYKYASEQPYMDSRYAQFMISPTHPETRSNSNWADAALLNATISPTEQPTVLYRNRDIYDMRQGWYRLTWDPIPQLESDYECVYTNGNVNYYRSQTSTNR